MPGRNVGFKPLEPDQRAQKIEDIVTSMARSQVDMAICLRAYYCGRGRKRVERWETANLLLTNAKLPVVRTKAHMDLAKRGEDRVYGALWGLSHNRPDALAAA